jgi:hypothetical protein
LILMQRLGKQGYDASQPAQSAKLRLQSVMII